MVKTISARRKKKLDRNLAYKLRRSSNGSGMALRRWVNSKVAAEWSQLERKEAADEIMKRWEKKPKHKDDNIVLKSWRRDSVPRQTENKPAQANKSSLTNTTIIDGRPWSWYVRELGLH